MQRNWQRRGNAAVALTALLVLAALDVSAQDDDSALVVAFGDSLSDTGMIYKLSGGLIPRGPWYWQGRFTSSPGNWQDYINNLNSSAISTYNQAVGGSHACSGSGFSLSTLIPTLKEQVALFAVKALTGNDGLKAALANKTSVTCVIWAGHNDIIDSDSLDASDLASDVAGCILDSVSNLLRTNLVQHVLVGTLAPLELTPDYRGNQTIANLVTNINQLIVQGVQDLQNKSESVAIWDAHTELSTLINNWQANGFTYNNSYSCLKYKPGQYVGKGNTPISGCSDPNDYLFLDQVHPTSRSHLFVAKELLATLRNNSFVSASVQIPAHRRLSEQWDSRLPQRRSLGKTRRVLRQTAEVRRW